MHNSRILWTFRALSRLSLSIPLNKENGVSVSLVWIILNINRCVCNIRNSERGECLVNGLESMFSDLNCLRFWKIQKICWQKGLLESVFVRIQRWTLSVWYFMICASVQVNWYFSWYSCIHETSWVLAKVNFPFSGHPCITGIRSLFAPLLKNGIHWNRLLYRLCQKKTGK